MTLKAITKPICIYTTFWDANNILDDRYVLFASSDGKNTCKINFLSDTNGKPQNFSIHSVALSHPSLDKIPLIKDIGITRLDFFCPTYNMLKRYKDDKNWEKYTGEFLKLVKGRKTEIKEWMNSLDNEHVYLLCCWEDTSKNAHCHRRLLYDSFHASKYAKKRMVSVYRDGKKKFKKDNSDYNSTPPVYAMPPISPQSMTYSNPVETLPF